MMLLCSYVGYNKLILQTKQLHTILKLKFILFPATFSIVSDMFSSSIYFSQLKFDSAIVLLSMCLSVPCSL